MGRHRAPGPATRPPRDEAAPVNLALVALIFGLALGVVIIDQATKALAISNLSEGQRIPVVGHILSLQLVHNPGAAFSLASGTTWVFTIIATVVVIFVARSARLIGSAAWAVFLGLLLGGATGNLIDRLFREPSFGNGHVVDFINYGGKFIGNVADVAIVSAAVGIAALAVLGIETDGSRIGRRSEAARTTEAKPSTVDGTTISAPSPDHSNG